VADALAAADLADFRDLFASEEIRALVFLPLIAGGRLLGKFMLYFGEPQAFGQEELDVAAAIAGQLAVCVARSRADAERERLLAESRQSARLMDVFVGVLSHDLRNPLGAIAVASDLLARQRMEQVRQPALRIRSSVDRMQRMIDQLLDFTRIRLGNGLPLSLDEFDLAPVARQVACELAAAFQPREVAIECTGQLIGRWDLDRVAQLLSNLGGNACQHGDEARPVAIRISGLAADHVHIEVESGGLVDEALRAALFEPGSKKPHSPGLGLGLYIAQQIAIAHGGRIDLACDEQADRTRVVVRLPRRPPASGTVRLDRITR
jgi:signal transduction histidine kinase